jgi:hypothetical protein
MAILERNRLVSDPNRPVLAAERAAALWSRLVPDADEIEISWHDAVEVVVCGKQRQRTLCPRCRLEIDTEWWTDLVSSRYDEGFDDLVVTVPCCESRVSINELDYDWGPWISPASSLRHGDHSADG